jgi:hypothetical protein
MILPVLTRVSSATASAWDLERAAQPRLVAGQTYDFKAACLHNRSLED